MCGYGGIGRRSGFKIHRWQHHGSSSLPIRTTLFFLVFLFANLANANFINLPNPGFYWTKQSLNKKIQKFIKKNKIKPSNLSIAIKATNPIKFFYIYRNANKYFTPASLNKIFIAVAALEEWGFKKHFTNSLWIKKFKKIKNKTLNSNLYFNGGGDPAFVSESMWNLARLFSHSNISKINGDLVILKKSFTSNVVKIKRKHRGDRAYEALAVPNSFNWNSVSIKVKASVLGKKAKIIIDPYKIKFLSIKNNVYTVPGKSSFIKIKRLLNKKKNILVLSGSIGVQAKDFIAYKNITQPALWLGHYLALFLKKRGIVINGRVRVKAFNKVKLSNYKKIAEVKSKALPLLLADMLKFSNNHIANTLSQQFIDYQLRIKKVFANIGKHKEYKYFLSPSGLSRKSKVKAKTLLRLLEYIKKQLYFPELLSALSIAGVDGTLKTYDFGKTNQLIRGKTGLLNSVVAFSGYVQRGKQEELLVSWIFNGNPKNTLKALRWRRDFLKLLLNN